jgi:hypothetical protein
MKQSNIGNTRRRLIETGEFLMRYVLCILLVAGLLGCGDGGRLASVDGRKVSGNGDKGVAS